MSLQEMKEYGDRLTMQRAQELAGLRVEERMLKALKEYMEFHNQTSLRNCLPAEQEELPAKPRAPLYKSVTVLAEEVLQTVDGVFDHQDLVAMLEERWPGDPRFMHGVYHACRQLIYSGKIRRVPGGYERIPRETPEGDASRNRLTR